MRKWATSALSFLTIKLNRVLIPAYFGGKMDNQSFYHCQHCREEINMEFTCPCCGLGNSSNYPMTAKGNLFDDFFSWLNVHRLGREHLFNQMREKYDWGYINACANIETELRRLIQEYKDDSDRITGN